MTDLFGDWVSDDLLDRIFAIMARAAHHRFIVVTKRAARMRAYCGAATTPGRVFGAASDLPDAASVSMTDVKATLDRIANWPLPNVALLVSAEDQTTADERIPELLATPAAIRGVSAEPLLGPIDWRRWIGHEICDALGGYEREFLKPYPGLDWIIVGGESGPGARFRDGFRDAALSTLRQCAEADVPFFGKQDVGKRRLPPELDVQQFPTAWAQKPTPQPSGPDLFQGGGQ